MEHPVLNPEGDLQALVMERLDALDTAQLAHLGRPPGKPARFLKCEGDMFTYEVMSKRIPAHHGDAAREMLQRGRKMGQTEEVYQATLSEEFARMRTTRTCLSRKTVARNAVARIRQTLIEGHDEPGE